MATTQKKHSGFGVGVIAFVIAIGATMGYFQFVYLPFINLKPVVAEEILNPESIFELVIIPGSADPEQTDNFMPKQTVVTLTENNKVVWKNEDEVGHTVTTDDEAEDRYSGLFDSLDTIGLIQPGETFEFLFTEEGKFPYHCAPHPWMKGTITVEKEKF